VIPRLPELRDDIGVGTAAIGAMLTVASAAGLVSSATCSRVIARFGTRLVLLVGGLLISAALHAVGLASTLPVALVAIAGMFAFDVYVDVAALLR
jgi:predicted MFS family arabinose efflux permease